MELFPSLPGTFLVRDVVPIIWKYVGVDFTELYAQYDRDRRHRKFDWQKWANISAVHNKPTYRWIRDNYRINVITAACHAVRNKKLKLAREIVNNPKIGCSTTISCLASSPHYPLLAEALKHDPQNVCWTRIARRGRNGIRLTPIVDKKELLLLAAIESEDIDTFSHILDMIVRKNVRPRFSIPVWVHLITHGFFERSHILAGRFVSYFRVRHIQGGELECYLISTGNRRCRHVLSRLGAWDNDWTRDVLCPHPLIRRSGPLIYAHTGGLISWNELGRLALGCEMEVFMECAVYAVRRGGWKDFKGSTWPDYLVQAWIDSCIPNDDCNSHCARGPFKGAPRDRLAIRGR
jgi:hypothetical protein